MIYTQEYISYLIGRSPKLAVQEIRALPPSCSPFMKWNCSILGATESILEKMSWIYNALILKFILTTEDCPKMTFLPMTLMRIELQAVLNPLFLLWWFWGGWEQTLTRLHLWGRHWLTPQPFGNLSLILSISTITNRKTLSWW